MEPYKVKLSYPANLYPVMDRTVEKIADRFDGFNCGGGLGFGVRDLDYIFPSLRLANGFVERIGGEATVHTVELIKK